MKAECRKLGSDDIELLIQLLNVYALAFEMEDFALPDREYLQGLLEIRTTFFYVATAKNQVLGGFTAHILPSTYESLSEVYIYDFAVHPEFHRKRVGSQLVESLKEYSTNLGFKEIYVQADLEDQHAISFYKSTGGQQANAVHFSYKLS